jgi:chorismate mutase
MPQASQFLFVHKETGMSVRGIRGATTTSQDEPGAILSATRELLAAILEANPSLCPEDIASALFTLTDDLSAAYPARAARELGWTDVPLMCAKEIPVPGSLPCCIRVLLHWNTSLPQSAVRHVYLREAAGLRPDLVSK